MLWSEWVRRVTGGASARQIASKIHRSPTSVSKWVREDGVPADVVIAIARAYGGDPVEGLLAARCLTMQELVPHLRSTVRYTPQSFLVDELYRRSVAWETATIAGEEFRPWFWMPDGRSEGLRLEG